jgi:hypothetical protein
MATRSATPCPPTTTWPSSSASATICKTVLPARGEPARAHAGPWRHLIAAWHKAHVTNGPTEAGNNLIKRVKRIAFGLTHFRHYRRQWRCRGCTCTSVGSTPVSGGLA